MRLAGNVCSRKKTMQTFVFAHFRLGKSLKYGGGGGVRHGPTLTPQIYVNNGAYSGHLQKRATRLEREGNGYPVKACSYYKHTIRYWLFLRNAIISYLTNAMLWFQIQFSLQCYQASATFEHYDYDCDIQPTRIVNIVAAAIRQWNESHLWTRCFLISKFSKT